MARRSKQTRIPGTEPLCIPPLDQVAEGLEEIRTKRIEFTAEEVKLDAQAVKLLKEHKLEEYHPADAQYTIQLKRGKPGKDKAKIKRLKTQPQDGDDGTGEDSRAGKDPD